MKNSFMYTIHVQEDGKMGEDELSCLDKSFSEGLYPLYPPHPLGSSLPGHPLVFMDGPGSSLSQLGIARAHLVQLG